MPPPSEVATSTPLGEQKAWPRRWRPALLTVSLALLAFVLVEAHAWRERPQGGFALGSLPGFDAYVYAAMAERPAVFTVAPWGYRILTPTLAHALSPSRPLRAFRWITVFALTGAALLLYAFARRVGFLRPAALLGMAAFCLSAPVGAALASPFPGDGLAVGLETAVLLGVTTGASLPWLLPLMALGLLTKDLFVLFVPLAYVPLRRSLGRGRAVGVTCVLVLAAIGLSYGLRAYWTPQIQTPHPILDRQLFLDFLDDLRASGGRPLIATLLGGLLPLALLGALRRAARPFLTRYGYLVALTLALPFLAWLNVPATRVFGFFGDVPRLHVYALPLLVPLALLALDRIWPVFDGVRSSTPPKVAPRLASWALGGGTVLILAFPFLAVDTYRRYPLHDRREGIQVFQTCRTSLRVAARLAHGDTVELTSHVIGTDLAEDLARRRWYLMEGWPDPAVFGAGAFVLRGTTPGVVLVPCLAPQALTVSARVRVPRPTALEAAINSQPLSAAAVQEGLGTVQWSVPADALFRGDNVLRLRIRDGGPVFFDSLSLSAVGPMR